MEDYDAAVNNPDRMTTARHEVLTWDPAAPAEELFCPILSVDDHVLEPATLFQGRMPAALVDGAPRLVLDDRGVPAWLIDDLTVPLNMMNGPVGHPMAQWRLAPLRYDEFLPGVSDATLRLADMDLCGVYASLCFPSLVWGFAGTRFARMRDERVGLAALRAYNQWMIEDWCSAAPERYVPCQLAWLRDPEVAAREIRANAEKGFKAVSFSENPEPLGFGSIHGPHWDPFFRACAETGTVVNLHVGSSGQIQMPSTNSPGEVGVALFPVNSVIAAVDWVFSRATIRHPGLTVVLSEGGASWVPMVVERLNRAWRQRDVSTVWQASDPSPAEVFRRDFAFASIEDPSVFRAGADVDLGRVMVEVDYPHGDSTWPAAQRLVREELGHLDPETVQDVCFRNAARIYRHPLPPDDLLASSVVGRATRELVRP